MNEQWFANNVTWFVWGFSMPCGFHACSCRNMVDKPGRWLCFCSMGSTTKWCFLMVHDVSHHPCNYQWFGSGWFANNVTWSVWGFSMPCGSMFVHVGTWLTSPVVGCAFVPWDQQLNGAFWWFMMYHIIHATINDLVRADSPTMLHGLFGVSPCLVVPCLFM